MCDMACKYPSPCLSSCLVWWSVITWLIEWSDPFSIGCAIYFLHFPCLVHLMPNIINFIIAFVKFKFRCLGPCWTVFSYMSSFVTTKACDLTQPSIVVSFEVCSNAIFRNITILLTIMIAISCIVILNVTPYLVLCPCGLGCAFKCSMSILLTVITVSFKFFCPLDFAPTFLSLMSLLLAFLTICHELCLCTVICFLASANIRCMSILPTMIACRFRGLTFWVSFFSSFGWFTFFIACVP